jgi:cytochrome c oxidase subunit III
MEAAAIKKEDIGRNKINSQLFSLWVGMGSVIMLFGAFTSAYIVRQGAGNWLQFTVPYQFFISTAVIALSSISLHMAYNAYKQRVFDKYKNLLLLSTALGVVFVVYQYLGWMAMFAQGVDLKANVGGSFFYLITGAHAAHVLGGITVLILSCLFAYAKPMAYSETRRNRIEMCLHFWHFLGGLWIYLFVFLNIIR